MASTVEKLAKSRVRIEATVEAQDFMKAIETAYQKTRGRYAVQGFRRGRAPRAIIERFYGKEVFYEDAIEELWRDAFESAIAEHDLSVVSAPTVNVRHAVEGEPVTLIMECAVYPEVKLGQYKGVEVVNIVPEVTDEQVEAVIERERNNLVRYIEADRPIENGDRIIFDYKGRVGEEYFEGGEAKGAQLDIGSGRFIPGFEEAMIGIPKEEEREISVTFPEEYHAEDLAGKKAVFEVLVHEIRYPEYPDVDDEFAKDVSDFDTLAEWKADIKENMLKDAQRRATATMQNEALGKIADGCEMEIPEIMIEGQIDRLLENLQNRLAYNGLTLEMYCQYAGVTLDDLREQNREEAQRRVKNQVALDEVTKVENITATPEEIAAKTAEYAQYVGKSVEEFEASASEDEKKYLEEDVIIDKTLDFILENAVKVDAPQEPVQEEDKK